MASAPIAHHHPHLLQHHHPSFDPLALYFPIAHHPHFLHPFDPLATAALYFGAPASPTISTGLYGHSFPTAAVHSPGMPSAVKVKREPQTMHTMAESVRPPSSLSLVSTPSPGSGAVRVKREPGMSDSVPALSPGMKPKHRLLANMYHDHQRKPLHVQPIDLRSLKTKSPALTSAVESSETVNDEPERVSERPRRSADCHTQVSSSKLIFGGLIHE